MNRRVAPAPKGLRAGGPGRKLWRAVREEYSLRPDEVEMLSMACATVDQLEDLRAALDGEPLTMVGQRGSTVAHPLLDEVRRHSALVARLLEGLGLDEADRDPSAASNAGRALASTRWRPRS